eukprot:1909514-Prorocentrum_lima.AAC.1
MWLPLIYKVAEPSGGQNYVGEGGHIPTWGASQSQGGAEAGQQRGKESLNAPPHQFVDLP